MSQTDLFGMGIKTIAIFLSLWRIVLASLIKIHFNICYSIQEVISIFTHYKDYYSPLTLGWLSIFKEYMWYQKSKVWQIDNVLRIKLSLWCFASLGPQKGKLNGQKMYLESKWCLPECFLSKKMCWGTAHCMMGYQRIVGNRTPASDSLSDHIIALYSHTLYTGMFKTCIHRNCLC